VVYISEAHSMDEWPLGSKLCVLRHRSIQDRIDVAKKYLVEERGCKIDVLVDTMENEFESMYQGWPERFFILWNREMALIGEPSEEDKGFNREDVVMWLKDHRDMMMLEKKMGEGEGKEMKMGDVVFEGEEIVTE